MIVTNRTFWCRVGAAGLFAAAGLAACAGTQRGAAVGIGNNAEDVQDAVPIERRSDVIGRQDRTSRPMPKPAPEQQSESGKQKGTVEAPAALLAAVKDDLARRVLTKPETINVVSAVEVTWPNGGLGCGRPGEMYTQATEPGYRIVLGAAGKEYQYHSDLRGRFVLCDSSGPLVPVREQLKAPAPAQ